MRHSRRTILGWLASMGVASQAAGLIAQSAVSAVRQSSLAADPRRPQFHLLPVHNWMNDPNGPIYVNGSYHMFFQYNPESAVWGNMSWAHAVSSDMVHWNQLPVAFTMTPGSADAAGCFSGSAIVRAEDGHDRVYVIYTGIVNDKEHETIRNEGRRESQCLAWSDDPMLLQWTKLDRPVLPSPPAGLKITGFRDPSVWKHDDGYLMTVGSGVEQEGGCVLLYRSTDLRTWEYLHPLTSGRWNGIPTSNPCDDGEMWECPDFFALDGRHVLIYSTLGKVFWQSGEFDPKSLRFHALKEGVLDLDAFYAPKTQLDSHGNRILWGWIPERRSNAEMLEAGWSGMMSLPRRLQLDQSGVLRLEFAAETNSLRRRKLPAQGSADGTHHTLPRATGEFLCGGPIDQRFEVVISTAAQELVRIQYVPGTEHRLMVGERHVELGPEDLPEIHGFVDGSVLELIVSQRMGYTHRFYYPGTVAPDVRITVSGRASSSAAWSLRPISEDRLTTASTLPERIKQS